MAEVTKNVLKGYFTKGSVPTQGNYADLVDTLVTQSEMSTAIGGVNSSITATEGDIATIAAILGKGQNETLTQLAAKFTALTGNYANVYAFVSKVKAFLEDADATDETINRWQEIESFLTGITDSDSLTAMLADLKFEIEGDLSIDSALSSTSEHALQNKVLYDELRITETGIGSVLSYNGTSYPIETIDASTLEDKEWNDGYDTYHDGMKVLPVLDPTKAYKIVNTSYVIPSDGNTEEEVAVYQFIFQNSGTFLLNFPEIVATNDDVANGYMPTIPIVQDQYGSGNVTLAEVSSAVGQSNWVSITTNSTYHPYKTNDGGESYVVDNDTTYYGIEESQTTVSSILSGATETTGSASTVKSLKQKIAELETRLVAVPTNYLEFATDMSAYSSAATGKVLLYLGATTQDFTHGYVYEKTSNGWSNLSVSPVIA